ncbi:unnamed protein product [Spirodela intermedia]|uniref:Uncharacterized protein n=1 Tax=Spirodela intermedia TaxID=51605 RepID=A0A7I8IS47_SPIIN|nr:unnamed protein product [Spirodela intermedia]CAA6660826.1 unnamed protein product [Spirodela intermedia]
MAKRRKSVASRLDEVDRTIYSSFCNAANSLSQIYTQAMNQQKIAFQAGERHGVEKIQSWISRRLEEGSTPTIADLLGYLQKYNQNPFFLISSDLISSNSFRMSSSTEETRRRPCPRDRSPSSPTAPTSTRPRAHHLLRRLSLPPRRSLAVEPPAGGFFPGGAAFVSGDTAMDTHSDGPSQDLY